MNIAEELSLKGLAGGKKDNELKPDTNAYKPKPQSCNPKTLNSQQITDDDFKRDHIPDTFTQEKDETEIKTVAVPNSSFIGELHELDDNI